LRNGKLDEAIACYEKSIQLNLNNYWSNLQLGHAFTAKGETDKAISHYRRVCYQKTIRSKPDLLHKIWNLDKQRKPDFLIIGVGKGGTTSLYQYLAEHPQILPTAHKEIDFFSNHFKQGIDWYLSHFPPIFDHQKFLSGEAPASYLSHADVPQKVYSLLPGVKLIVLLRNPADRAISHYYHHVRDQQEDRSLEEAVISEIRLLQQVAEANLENQSEIAGALGYVLHGLYFYALKRWMTVFPREQFLILKSENLYTNPSDVMGQVYQFLGLPQQSLSKYPNHYPGFYRSSPDNSVRSMLMEYFRPYNDRLESYLEMPFNWQ